MKFKGKKNPNRIIKGKSIFDLKPLFGKKKKSPVNFKLFPGKKMPVGFDYTYKNKFLGMSNKDFNELPRKERREIYRAAEQKAKQYPSPSSRYNP